MCVRCGTGKIAMCEHPTRHAPAGKSKITLKDALKPFLEHNRWPSLAAADSFTEALARGRITGLDYRPYERQPAFCRYCGEELTKRVQGHVTYAARAGGPWHSIWQNGPEASAYCTESTNHKHVPGDAS